MAVTVTVSTKGGFKVFSSVNATLSTAIAEVINEVEDQKLSGRKVQFNTTFDDTGQEYIVLAYVSTGSGTANA
jgi:hypothetical protein